MGILGQPLEQAAASDPQSAGGAQISAASGQTSFTLGLTGACLSLDTACSSQLVAMHVARTSLIRHECLEAIASGVGLLGPIFTEAFAS